MAKGAVQAGRFMTGGGHCSSNGCGSKYKQSTTPTVQCTAAKRRRHSHIPRCIRYMHAAAPVMLSNAFVGPGAAAGGAGISCGHVPAHGLTTPLGSDPPALLSARGMPSEPGDGGSWLELLCLRCVSPGAGGEAAWYAGYGEAVYEFTNNPSL